MGAGLIGLVTGLPIWSLLLLVASSPLLAGILGTMFLIRQHRTDSLLKIGGSARQSVSSTRTLPGWSGDHGEAPQ